MVPLRARDGGVLTRKGHTESAVGGSLHIHFKFSLALSNVTSSRLSVITFLRIVVLLHQSVNRLRLRRPPPLLDLCKLTGRAHAGLLCELVNDDPQGTMARRDDCRKFANKHGLKMISVEMIANYIQSLQASSTAPAINGAAS